MPTNTTSGSICGSGCSGCNIISCHAEDGRLIGNNSSSCVINTCVSSDANIRLQSSTDAKVIGCNNEQYYSMFYPAPVGEDDKIVYLLKSKTSTITGGITKNFNMFTGLNDDKNNMEITYVKNSSGKIVNYSFTATVASIGTMINGVTTVNIVSNTEYTTDISSTKQTFQLPISLLGTVQTVNIYCNITAHNLAFINATSNTITLNGQSRIIYLLNTKLYQGVCLDAKWNINNLGIVSVGSYLNSSYGWFASGSDVHVDACFSTGIIPLGSAGILGNFSGAETNQSVEYCYTTGEVIGRGIMHAGSANFCYVDGNVYGTSIGPSTISNCYAWHVDDAENDDSSSETVDTNYFLKVENTYLLNRFGGTVYDGNKLAVTRPLFLFVDDGNIVTTSLDGYTNQSYTTVIASFVTKFTNLYGYVISNSLMPTTFDNSITLSGESSILLDESQNILFKSNAGQEIINLPVNVKTGDTTKLTFESNIDIYSAYMFSGNSYEIDGENFVHSVYVDTFNGMCIGNNLTIKNVIMGSQIGSVVGGWITGNDSSNNVVENCSSYGNIINDGGGICGSNTNNVTIKNCYSTGDIDADAGGICGSSSIDVTISECYSTGKIIGNGICGTNSSGSITNCYSTGDIYNTGIAGNFQGSITNCYSAGSIITGAGIYSNAGTIQPTVTQCFSNNPYKIINGAGSDLTTSKEDTLDLAHYVVAYTSSTDKFYFLKSFSGTIKNSGRTNYFADAPNVIFSSNGEPTDLSKLPLTAVATDINDKGYYNYITEELVPESNICLYYDVEILTDQGKIMVSKLTNKYTIGGYKILGITRTRLTDTSLVIIPANLIDKNIPCRDTIVSLYHRVWYMSNLHAAHSLPSVNYVPYNQEIMYNVILEHHSLIRANNMLVETLKIEKIIPNYIE